MLDEKLAINCLSSGYRIEFPAYLTEYSEDFSPKWSSKEMYGKMDPISTFQSTKRKGKVTIDVPSKNLQEAKQNYEEMMRLLESLYPGFDVGANGAVGAVVVNAPPLFKISLLSYLNETLCVVQDLSFSPQIESGFFTEEKDFMHIYPKLFKITLSFDILHTTAAETGLFMDFDELEKRTEKVERKPGEPENSAEEAEAEEQENPGEGPLGAGPGADEPCAGLSKKDRLACEKQQGLLKKEEAALEKRRAEEKKAEEAREQQAAKTQEAFEKLAADIETGKLVVGSKEYAKRKRDAEAAAALLAKKEKAEQALEEDILAKQKKIDQTKADDEKLRTKQREAEKREEEKRAEAKKKLDEAAAGKKAKADAVAAEKAKIAEEKAAEKKAKAERDAAEKQRRADEKARAEEEARKRRLDARTAEEKARDAKAAAEAKAAADKARAKKKVEPPANPEGK